MDLFENKTYIDSLLPMDTDSPVNLGFLYYFKALISTLLSIIVGHFYLQREFQSNGLQYLRAEERFEELDGICCEENIIEDLEVKLYAEEAFTENRYIHQDKYRYMYQLDNVDRCEGLNSCLSRSLYLQKPQRKSGNLKGCILDAIIETEEESDDKNIQENFKTILNKHLFTYKSTELKNVIFTQFLEKLAKPNSFLRSNALHTNPTFELTTCNQVFFLSPNIEDKHLTKPMKICEYNNTGKQFPEINGITKVDYETEKADNDEIDNLQRFDGEFPTTLTLTQSQSFDMLSDDIDSNNPHDTLNLSGSNLLNEAYKQIVKSTGIAGSILEVSDNSSFSRKPSRHLSPAELRIKAATEKLNAPSWYRNSTVHTAVQNNLTKLSHLSNNETINLSNSFVNSLQKNSSNKFNNSSNLSSNNSSSPNNSFNLSPNDSMKHSFSDKWSSQLTSADIPNLMSPESANLTSDPDFQNLTESDSTPKSDTLTKTNSNKSGLLSDLPHESSSCLDNEVLPSKESINDNNNIEVFNNDFIPDLTLKETNSSNRPSQTNSLIVHDNTTFTNHFGTDSSNFVPHYDTSYSLIQNNYPRSKSINLSYLPQDIDVNPANLSSKDQIELQGLSANDLEFHEDIFIQKQMSLFQHDDEGMHVSVTDYLDTLGDQIITIRCRRKACRKNQELSLARRTYKMCHNCYTYYCSRDCRQIDWEKHKSKCILSSINSITKKIVNLPRDNVEFSKAISNVCKAGFYDYGKGYCMLALSNLADAELILQYIYSELTADHFHFVPLSNLDRQRHTLGSSYQKVQELLETCDPQYKFTFVVAFYVDDYKQMSRRNGLIPRESGKYIVKYNTFYWDECQV